MSNILKEFEQMNGKIEIRDSKESKFTQSKKKITGCCGETCSPTF